MKQLQAIPEWHSQVAAELSREFVEVEQLSLNAQKRRVYLGLKFLWVKGQGREDGTIPHGTFMAWLGRHCPHIPRRTASRYMTEAESVAERVGWKVGELSHLSTPPHLLIEGAHDNLPPREKKSQQLLLGLLGGDGKFQPVTTWMQVEEGEDGARVKRGRLKGEGGRVAAPPDSEAEALLVFRRQWVARRMEAAAKELEKMGTEFALLPDGDLEKAFAIVNRTAKAMRHWLDTAPAQRNAEALARVWRSK